jgi:IS5 family transposase
LISGKKDSKNEIKKLYKSIIKISKKLQSVFSEAVERAFSKIGDILPSLKHSLESLCEFIRLDLHDIELCRTNARKRIVENQIVPAEDKVLSISDDDAEIIPKGSKELVFGYKPQIGRSEKGFIVSVIVPQGAASDSDQMRAITDFAIKNTSVIPEVLSYDDGYTNKKERENYLNEGIKVVSFSGSKGKKLTSEVWDDDEYLAARNERSMAESTMSVLKGYFGLHRFSRRGIEAVTQELLTASIFHNLRLLAKLM